MGNINIASAALSSIIRHFLLPMGNINYEDAKVKAAVAKLSTPYGKHKLRATPPIPRDQWPFYSLWET